MMTSIRAAILVGALVVFLGPLAGIAGTRDLTGTRWQVTGRTRVAGVARYDNGRRRLFRENEHVQLTATFPVAGQFTVHDDAGWDYAGTYEQRGRRGMNVRATFDDASESELDQMLSSWLSNLAEENVTSDADPAPVKMVLHAARGTIRANRRFTAQSSSAHARGLWTLRGQARLLAE